MVAHWRNDAEELNRQVEIHAGHRGLMCRLLLMASVPILLRRLTVPRINMKLKANREQLQRAFQMAASVAPTRSPKPILQNVLMSIRPGSATIMATDSEVGVRIEIDDVETDDTGRIILNVIRVGAILRECKAETVEITAASGKVAIKAGGSRFNLNSEDEGDFPDVPHMKPGGH